MAVSRAMVISYGSQSVPGTVGGTRLELHGPHKLIRGDVENELTFQMLVCASTALTLAAACSTLETAFSTKRDSVTITLDGNVAVQVSPGLKTAFDVTPRIEKVGDTSPQFDSNLTRLYEVTISWGSPVKGSSNVVGFQHVLELDGSRIGRLTFTGEYRANLGGQLATANYLSLISGRVSTITTALGGTWELVSERYTPDDEDFTCQFERIYKVVFRNQSKNTLASPALVDPNLLITKEKRSDDASLVSPGSGSGSRTRADQASGEPDALVVITAEYSSKVDRDITTDLPALWESTVRDLIFDEMETVAGGGVAIISAKPRYDHYANLIGATVVGEVRGSSLILSREVETEDLVDFGKVVREVWPDTVPDDEDNENPSPTPAYVYQTRRAITRVVKTITSTVAGAGAGTDDDAPNARTNDRGGGGATQGVGSAKFTTELMFRRTKSKRRKRGLREFGNRIEIIDREVEETFRILIVITGAAQADGAPQVPEVGGGSGGGSAGR